MADLYGVETKQLKRQVRRNIDRFPADFMFELSAEEFQEWRCQIGSSNGGDKMGLHYAPYVFTEQGVAMLSTVLNSERAIKVNIQIMRIYTKMREMLLTHKDHRGLALASADKVKKTNLVRIPFHTFHIKQGIAKDEENKTTDSRTNP